ncbi:response regulator [Pseudodesulfovibrio cashew]|uniref:Response regulator n=1 Tax=Pseudodesulfovibrio cashew TaxID=2678688 RepID=A0A6I6JEP2_9BACT|nr:response regulator transcription factor [Pseudodesulfovibrio cashew]QGY39540.1 response regulator [Pseudodesulfovibrio cashew]
MRDLILIIDDDAKLRKMIGDYLAGYDYGVRELADGTDVAEQVGRLRPAVVILDVMMPGRDGFEVLSDIRRVSKVPVIMLTAKGDPSDRVVGLEMGADDYLPKPFNLRELLARIRAALRRYEPKSARQDVLEAGGVLLDLSRQVMRVESSEYDLGTAEFNVLSSLMRHPDVPLSRDTLLDMGWGVETIVSDRTVDVHVSRLRALLRNHAGHEDRIKTVWGTGYKFVGKSA